VKPSHEADVDGLLRARAEIDEALRRHKSNVTILFSDVVGSTSYFDRYGDTAGLAMLHRQGDLCSATIGEHGGTVIKTIGDSVMAEFSQPVAGVRAAIAIQKKLHALNETLADRERIRLRVGIHTGPAFRRDHDVFGDAVNVAARITKHTAPAQILISRAVREVVAGEADLTCIPLGKMTMEGRAEKEDVFEVQWTDPATYRDLREQVTAALARGDLVSPPGLRLDDLVAAASQPPAVSATAGGRALARELPGQKRISPLPERYEVIGEVGRGGMGVVYKALDRETGELVALKVLMPEIASDEKVLERFKNELRLARKITHKYVCRIHDLYRTPDCSFISMEFVEGESLRSTLNRFGTLSIRKTVQIGQQVCEGLQEAHAQGIVHRDLKPENVILDQNGNVKLMDFGIARSVSVTSTSPDVVMGTPAYMAPEQAEGKAADSRADIYALGLLLYEMLTGIPAFVGDTPIALAIKQIQENPAPPHLLEPSLPPRIERVILQCLEKKRERRFTTAKELGEALCASVSEDILENSRLSPRRVAAPFVLAGLLAAVFWLGRATKWVPPPAKEANVGASAQPQNRTGSPENSAASTGSSVRDAGIAAAQGKGGPPTAGDGGLASAIARNSRELEQLKKQNEQVRFFKLDLQESAEFSKIGPIQMRLNKASVKKQLYNLAFETQEHVVEMKDRTLYEPVRFYDERTRHTLEVVVYKIENGHITGYLSDPGTAPSSPPIPKPAAKQPSR
jgi:serine/threonine protein kinase/class 3 adenylate cyclase